VRDVVALAERELLR